jgi:hypothetical protein
LIIQFNKLVAYAHCSGGTKSNAIAAPGTKG